MAETNTTDKSSNTIDSRMCPLWGEENKPKGLEGCISGSVLSSANSEQFIDYCSSGQKYVECPHYKKHLRSQEEKAAKSQNTPANPDAHSNGKYVLFVDDEQFIRVLASRALGNGKSEYSLVTAEDGEDALQKIQEKGAAPTVLVTDMIMPRMGGAELIGKVREKYGYVPTIIITGYSNNQLEELNPDAVFTKPLILSDLKTTINRFYTGVSANNQGP